MAAITDVYVSVTEVEAEGSQSSINEKEVHDCYFAHAK